MSAFGPGKRRYIDKYSYSLSNVLGQGYSGTVHLGKNEQQGKLCAIKIIQKSILKYQAHKSMILCQIEFLTLLKDSEKILTLYDVYNTKNNIYLVLQLCNADLKQYICAKNMISEPEAIDIMKNILVGYKAIWKAKIVHRDLKPSNILLQDQEIKIADFGFSMFEKDQKEFEMINVGSPYYMPFQVLTCNIYSYASDIWALGIIYYEMVTGRIPWNARTQKQLFRQMKEFDIQKTMPENLSQKSKQFLTRTLEMDPKKRIKPQELVEFKFYSFQTSIDEGLRKSCRSQEAKTLQRTVRQAKVIHDPEQRSRVQCNKLFNEDKDKEDQIEEINISVPDQDKNDLAHSRMKKQNNGEFLDQVNELPSSPKKRKTALDRKTSLETKCQIFQIEEINARYSADNLEKEKEVLTVKLPISTKTLPTTPPIKSSPSTERKRSSPQITKKYTKKQPQSKEVDIKENEEMKMRSQHQEAMKSFSKVLRSQIHFCRYVYKLLMRVIEHIPNEINLVKPELKEQMAAFVFLKLKKIESERMSDPSIQKEWLQTKQWDKIKTVIKQYRSRYNLTIRDVQDINVNSQYDDELFKKLLRKAILYLYKRAYEAFVAEQERQEKESKTKVKRAESQKSTEIQQDDESLIMKIKEQILILDYFITLKQLHKLQEKYGWEVFEQKSKIQNIVDGQPLKYIQKKHILAISSKIQSLKIL